MATKNRWSVALGVAILIGAIAIVLDKVFHVNFTALGMEGWRYIVAAVVLIWIIQDLAIKEWRWLPAQLCLIFALLQPAIAVLAQHDGLWAQDWLVVLIGFMVSFSFKLIFRKK